MTLQMHQWFRPKRAWAVLASVVLLVIVRYIAWRHGFAWLPWTAYLIVWGALSAAIIFWIRQPAVLIIALLGTSYMGWELAWLDNVLAEKEFAELCSEKAGVRIYKRVELNQEYFTENGGFIFVDQGGYVMKEKFPSDYEFIEESSRTQFPSRFTDFSRWHWEVRDRRNGEIVAEQSQFSGRRGGPPLWTETNPIKGGECPHSMGKSINEFFLKTFEKHSGSESE